MKKTTTGKAGKETSTSQWLDLLAQQISGLSVSLSLCVCVCVCVFALICE